MKLSRMLSGVSGRLYMCISGLPAAMLDLRLPLTPDNILNSFIEFLVPKNMGIAVGIVFLSRLQAEICLAVAELVWPRWFTVWPSLSRFFSRGRDGCGPVGLWPSWYWPRWFVADMDVPLH